MGSKGITVRRTVLAAAQQLEQQAETNDKATSFDLAEQKINECVSAADRSGAKFWRAVLTHLMLVRYVPAEITVVPDDDNYRPQFEQQETAGREALESQLQSN